MDINISSQIVVQTAAQWAVDNTVYSAKRILVTSNEYYGSTDQRKFKIADGVQTWSNLDYMPIEQVTTSTIGSAINGATSATPNDTDLVMSVESSVAKKNTWTQIKAFLKTYFDTVYQAAGSYLTSVNITQTITNGVTDKAPSEDAVYARFKQVTLFYQRTTDVTYTGFTGNTFLEEVEIPADYLGPNSEIEVSVTFERNSGGTSTNTCYVGLSNSSSTFNTRGYIQLTTTQLQGGMFKRFVFKNGDTIKYQQISIQTQDFWVQTSTARNTLTLDRTQPIYVSINGSLGTSTDSIIINEYRIMIYNRA